MNKKIMITGANSGLGLETARQLALLNETEKIFLACRNQSKATAAKNELEKETQRNIFEIVLMDVSSPESVRIAVQQLNEPIDALIMNAGGTGGKTPNKLTKEGVTQLFASNVIGHVVLVNELIRYNKLNNVALYASSEAVRGVKKMGMKPPQLNTSSVNEFVSVFNGSFFGNKFDAMEAYGYIKYSATLWMASQARKHPHIRFVSMSPGATSGTAVMNDLPPVQKFLFKYVGFPVLMPLMGMVHKVEKGAKRYVNGINDDSFKSGLFYASKANQVVGPVVEQSDLFPDLTNELIQDNAYEAIHHFIN